MERELGGGNPAQRDLTENEKKKVVQEDERSREAEVQLLRARKARARCSRPQIGFPTTQQEETSDVQNRKPFDARVSLRHCFQCRRVLRVAGSILRCAFVRSIRQMK